MPSTGSSIPRVYRSGWKMFAWGRLAQSVLRAWISQPISQAKKAESPGSMMRSWVARGQVRATVRAA